MYCVYKHTNRINGKIYIGITCNKPEYRWGKDGNGYKNNLHFINAINKYGWENFKHEILKAGLSKEQAEFLEIDLIREANSTNPEYGYNIAPGGNAMSDETKSKISNARKQMLKENPALNPMLGKHYSDEEKEIIRQRSIETARYGKNNPMFGMTKGKHPRSKSVAQYDIYGNFIATYTSITEASEATGQHIASIVQVCKGKRKQCRGYVWKYAQ